MAQNEMKAKLALPERVRSMEGLGVLRESARFEYVDFISSCVIVRMPRGKSMKEMVQNARWRLAA